MLKRNFDNIYSNKYTTMELWIDDREHKVHSWITNENQIPIKVQRLVIGDYCLLCNGQIVAVLERKTWTDLANSIRDGRKHNVVNLLELRKTTGCKIMYLVEGNATPPLSSKFGRLEVSRLIAHLDHLAFRHDISVINSKSAKYTLERLLLLAKNYQSSGVEQPPAIGGTAISTPENLKDIKPKRTNTDVRMAMWCTLKGVSDATAQLLDAHYHIRVFLKHEITIQQLAQLQYPKGATIGTVRATKILNSIDVSAILCCLPGISKKTADVILQQGSLFEGQVQQINSKVRISLETFLFNIDSHPPQKNNSE
jgi:ERCC4-type nuclease